MSLHCLKLQNWTYLPESGALLCDLPTVSSPEVIWRMSVGRCATIPAIIVDAERLREWRTAKAQGSSAAAPQGWSQRARRARPAGGTHSGQTSEVWQCCTVIPELLMPGNRLGRRQPGRQGALPPRVWESVNRNGLKFRIWTKRIQAFFFFFRGQDTFQCWFMRGGGGKMRNLHQLHLRCLCQYLFTGIYKLCLKNFGIIIESEQMSAGSHQSLFRSLEVIFSFFFFLHDSVNSRCLSELMETALPGKKRSEKQNFAGLLFALPRGTLTWCLAEFYGLGITLRGWHVWLMIDWTSVEFRDSLLTMARVS